MWRRTLMWVLVGAVVVGVAGVSQALAQGRPQGERRGPPRSREEIQRRIEEFRQRMAERLRERLGATEEEWKVLGPRIEKVQRLMREARGGFRGMFGMFSRGRGPEGGRRPEGAPQREGSEVEKKTAALRSLLEDPAASPASIKAALDALRKARQKVQADLAAARKELRELVTVKQEAMLVLMGILE